MTLDQVHQLCVADLPNSEPRAELMAQLRTFAGLLESLALSGELWVNGSFLTRRAVPRDVDVVFRVRGEVYLTGTQEQRQFLDSIRDSNQNSLAPQCHAHVLVVYPAGHALSATNEYNRAYWATQFGTSRQETPKGYAVVRVGGGL